jgi:hypothetical protein
MLVFHNPKQGTRVLGRIQVNDLCAYYVIQCSARRDPGSALQDVEGTSGAGQLHCDETFNGYQTDFCERSQFHVLEFICPKLCPFLHQCATAKPGDPDVADQLVGIFRCSATQRRTALTRSNRFSSLNSHLHCDTWVLEVPQVSTEAYTVTL